MEGDEKEEGGGGVSVPPSVIAQVADATRPIVIPDSQSKEVSTRC